MRTVINLNSRIYYKGTYWNDNPEVLKYMSKNFSGDESKWWVEDFRQRLAQKPFRHGLFLNCGDGRNEREFIDRDIVRKITAFDISPDLIKIAKKEKGARAISYIVADANKIDFKENEFDLIVNIAALHHVQYINRLCRILCKSLKNNGYLVNFDYIGPHRNQYPIRQWWWIKKINNSLPSSIRQTPLRYPDLSTILVNDPTEAIHSELIIESLNRYFKIVERHDTGGGIAYPILTLNNKVEQVPAERLKPHIRKILKWDDKLTKNKTVPPLFTYLIAQPDKNTLLNRKLIDKYQTIENTREKLHYQFKNVYYLSDFVKIVILNLKMLATHCLKAIVRYPYG